MSQKGQIVEIPATAPLFSIAASYPSKEAELTQLAMPKSYGLFDGFLVGEHQGVSAFRLGQRKGLQLGGKKQPAYVIGIDQEANRLFVGQGSHHPGLWASVLRFTNNGQLGSLAGDGQAYPVEMVTGADNSITQAILYNFPGSVFLQTTQPISIAVLDYPVKVRLQNAAQSLIQIN